MDIKGAVNVKFFYGGMGQDALFADSFSHRGHITQYPKRNRFSSVSFLIFATFITNANDSARLTPIGVAKGRFSVYVVRNEGVLKHFFANICWNFEDGGKERQNKFQR